MRFTSAFVAITLMLATGSIARAIDIESRSEALETRQFCTQQCLEEKPDCPKGEMASGFEGCWSACCVPIGPKVSFKKPEDQAEDKSGEKSGDESEKSGDETSDGEQGENKDGQEGDEILTY